MTDSLHQELELHRTMMAINEQWESCKALTNYRAKATALKALRALIGRALTQFEQLE